jgi:hypothetical protein
VIFITYPLTWTQSVVDKIWLRKKPGKGVYKVITARNMIEKEKKYYLQYRK